MALESKQNIDKIFSDRLSDFGSLPSNEVWNNIDKSLTRSSRIKKLFLITSITGLLLTGSYITYNITSNNSNKSSSITTQRDFLPKIKEIKKGIAVTPTIVDNKVNTIQNTDKVPVKTNTDGIPNVTENNTVVKNTNTEASNVIVEPEDNSPDEKNPEVTIIEAMRPNSNSNQSINTIKNTEGILEKNDTLTLSIEFANLERKLADKITIEQTIPDFLDINSITPVKSSHGYKFKVKRSQRKIIWTLKEIPANGVKGSKGYIDYDVVVIKKAKESQLKGQEVITFDYGYYRTKTTN